MNRDYEELRSQIEELDRKTRELQDALVKKELEFRDLLARIKALGAEAPIQTEWNGKAGSLGDIAGTISDKLA